MKLASKLNSFLTLLVAKYNTQHNWKASLS